MRSFLASEPRETVWRYKTLHGPGGLEKRSNLPGQTRFVAAETLDGRLKNPLRIEPLHVEGMTRLLRQKRQEAELGAAVALPKRMDGVQFGKEVSGFTCESRLVEAAQIIVRG